MSNNDQKLWTYHQTDNAKKLNAGHPRQDVLLNKINKIVKKGKVLEIGFGDGYLLNKLSSGYDCCGADISAENIEQMKKRIPSVKFDLIGVDGELPYEDNYFDGFVASEVLEHMTDKELVLCINEIRRVLRKDGYGIITVPAKENLKDNECFCPNCSEVFHKWGHKQCWHEMKIHSLFSGFDKIKIKEYYFSSPGLNIFGALGYWARKIIIEFLNFHMDGATFVIIIRK